MESKKRFTREVETIMSFINVGSISIVAIMKIFIFKTEIYVTIMHLTEAFSIDSGGKFL